MLSLTLINIFYFVLFMNNFFSCEIQKEKCPVDA